MSQGHFISKLINFLSIVIIIYVILLVCQITISDRTLCLPTSISPCWVVNKISVLQSHMSPLPPRLMYAFTMKMHFLLLVLAFQRPLLAVAHCPLPLYVADETVAFIKTKFISICFKQEMTKNSTRSIRE